MKHLIIKRYKLIELAPHDSVENTRGDPIKLMALSESNARKSANLHPFHNIGMYDNKIGPSYQFCQFILFYRTTFNLFFLQNGYIF